MSLEVDTSKLADGDLLFARAVVFFEGETEEQALPILAEAYWGTNIHELGFTFVQVGGAGNYFPFIWLAERLNIRWYVFSDGEPKPVSSLDGALHKVGAGKSADCDNVVVIPDGLNFESQLVAEGYLPEIELALNEAMNKVGYLDYYIDKMDGKSGKNGTTRDYKTAGGRERAACDVMSERKTRLAEPLASVLADIEEEGRRFPAHIRTLFEKISLDHGLAPAGEGVK